MDKVLAIIDGDGLVYHSSKETLQGSIDILDEKIQNIFDKTKATHYIIFISNSPYFRHKIDPFYKIGRSKYTSNLKWLKTLKNYLIEGWGAESMNLVEADDLVAYWYNKDLCIADDDGKIEPREVFEDALQYCIQEKLDTFKFKSMERVLCSPDKDLLESIPGKHFNYTYKPTDDAKQKFKDNPEYKYADSDIIKGWWVATTVNSTMNFKFQQLVCGDSADNISGIKGKGIKFFESNPDWDLCNILEWYLKVYGQAQGIFEYQKNYRLLHLLESDEDFIREVGVLPEFPEIREVPNKVQPVNNDEMKF